MDKFHTPVAIPESDIKINHHTKCLLMGSCFSDYIGDIMAGYKFPVLLNPFGTLFNPGSIAENIRLLIRGNDFVPGDLFFYDGTWLSFSHYTGFSNADQNTCLDRINNNIREASKWLKNADFLVLTFGTAWTYYLKETGKPVANCHKLPGSVFTRSLLRPGQIFSMYRKLLKELKIFNPDLKVIFTLSPVRHWADGAVNNQLSKSVLHFGIQEIVQKHENALYFPAYEIFMDELRDYRFYAPDMLHPSDQGTMYVWERFCETWIDNESVKIMAGLDQVIKAMGHRPVNAGSAAHKKFLENTLKKVRDLSRLYPFLDFEAELKHLP